MTEELLKIMQSDIVRCVKAQDDAKGSFELYQALVGKYSSKNIMILKKICRNREGSCSWQTF